jgi:hypothetical protein
MGRSATLSPGAVFRSVTRAHQQRWLFAIQDPGEYCVAIHLVYQDDQAAHAVRQHAYEAAINATIQPWPFQRRQRDATLTGLRWQRFGPQRGSGEEHPCVLVSRGARAGLQHRDGRGLDWAWRKLDRDAALTTKVRASRAPRKPMFWPR